MERVDPKERDAAEILTLEEVAIRLAVPVSTVARLAEQGELPGHTVDGQWRFHQWVVDEWGRRHGAGIRSRVLVVDDHQEIRTVLAELLATGRREILSVASGEEALAIVKATDVDLILLDLSLPGRDGAETFREIQALRPGVPVVIVTGYPDSAMMARALESGPFTMVSKPVHLDQLRRVVGRILRD
jgi:excisionase family DNA binding protein